MMHRVKYLFAFILPAITLYCFWVAESYYWLPIAYAFIVVPIFDEVIPKDDYNLPKEKEEVVKNEWWFNILLYLIVPAHFLVLYSFFTIDFAQLNRLELIWAIATTGLSCGVLGINVGHELGHKNRWLDKILAHTLLMSSLYMHFYIEHNYGHHKRVATKEDPATALRNETVYKFWFRSIVYSYISAWKIQFQLLQNRNFFSLKNNMFYYHIIQLLWLAFIYFYFGAQVFIYYLIIAFLGILLLETVNYIEHYGLLRKKKKGFYERTQAEHSWNSNHVFGRLVLFDLSRHSDHHYKSTRPYQILRYHENSPQLPSGYPTMMLLTLIPPLWFKVVHKTLDNFYKSINKSYETN